MPIGLRHFVAAIVLILLPGCATFKAVSATGKAGANIEPHADVLLQGPVRCNYARTLKVAGPKSCEAIEQDAAKWQKAAKMLAQYGGALDKLAAADDPAVAANVSSALDKGADAGWFSLTKDESSGLATVADKFVGLVTQAYRHAAIADTVTEANTDVAAVAERLIAHIDFQLSLVANIRSALEQLIKRPLGERCGVLELALGKLPDPGDDGTAKHLKAMLETMAAEDQQLCLDDNQADRIVYARLDADLRGQVAELRTLRRAVSGFEQAHRKLYENVQRQTFEDAEAYVEVVEALKVAYSALDEATSSPPAPGNTISPPKE